MPAIAIRKLSRNSYPPYAQPIDLLQDPFDLFCVRRLDLPAPKVDAAFQKIGIGTYPKSRIGKPAAGQKQERRPLPLPVARRLVTRVVLKTTLSMLSGLPTASSSSRTKGAFPSDYPRPLDA